MTTELKKCPFCGGEAKLYMKEDVCFLCCSECDCQARQCETEEEAIEAWNTRKPLEDIVEQLKEVQFSAEIEEPILAETNVTELFETQVVQLTDAIEIVKGGAV